jgi:hypothetical protein
MAVHPIYLELFYLSSLGLENHVWQSWVDLIGPFDGLVYILLTYKIKANTKERKKKSEGSLGPYLDCKKKF